ncbi:protein GL2-INTERACTING REPRESSOR 1-like [Curcuma longa]|uniref:protein GL2-INTERACTING REPRESSOR 1-like n=1 Tax=Curcuma longa TaxID=136217 RepID=UPI003D9E8740
MSGRGGRRVDLKLNVSAAETSRRQMAAESPRRRSPSSEPSSCVSSESESPGAAAAMVLAACPRCLMYVMLSEDDEPKCPKCNRDVLLDFLAGSSAAKEAN